MAGKRVSAAELTALNHASRGRRAREGTNSMAAIFNVFPLILIPVLIYNIIAFAGGNNAEVRANLENPWFQVPMASQEPGVAGVLQTVQWSVTSGDVLVVISLVLLFIELLKSTSTGTSAIFNHALSMLVFIICLVEFLLGPGFATTTFFMIMVMSLLDVLAGVVVTIVSARRDVEFGGGGN